MSIVDTCNALVERALAVFSGDSGINAQLTAMALTRPLPALTTILKMSAPVEVYEKTTALRYPVATICCERVKNTQAEKFRMFSGSALLVVDIRVSGERAEDLEISLNTYVQAACLVLEGAVGPWTTIGTYTGTYDVKFQAMRYGGKQFTKSARIEFDVLVSR
jgi:hypothetical protein